MRSRAALAIHSLLPSLSLTYPSIRFIELKIFLEASSCFPSSLLSFLHFSWSFSLAQQISPWHSSGSPPMALLRRRLQLRRRRLLSPLPRVACPLPAPRLAHLYALCSPIRLRLAPALPGPSPPSWTLGLPLSPQAQFSPCSPSFNLV